MKLLNKESNLDINFEGNLQLKKLNTEELNSKRPNAAFKKSLNPNLQKLTQYSTDLNKISSNLSNKNQLILNTKISKVRELALEDTAQSSNLNRKGKKYYERIDMLNVLNVEKYRQNNPLARAANILNLYPVQGINNIILSNYLKSFSKFNVEIAKSQNINFKFNNVKNKFLKNISSILENSFMTMSSLISRPIYNITPHKVVIRLLFFLVNKNNSKIKKSKFLSVNSKNLEILCANLSKILKKPVELDLVKLHYPFYDSNILANLLGRICDINYKPYIFILDKIFNKANIKNPTIRIPETNSNIPTFLTGLKIRLAGRLLKQKIVPRHTVKTTQHGSLTRSSADIVTNSRFTSKNKRGTFSFTVTMGHRFF